ncbi:alpha/beta hydrolase [Devosia sp. Root105]|uniref:alpha/beta hydrolase n=1 Tax=Devosia sp. Root105 TaxID=1736423 RepID=UPI0006F9D73F|nr:alpha/beta hydrolase [Devosia sp. Root105]KQU95278.1 alpha/beta hydrolase [Devosia sp. Root105]
MTTSRPALDPELARLLAELPAAPALDAESLPLLRQYKLPAEAFIEGRSIERRELTVTAADGAELPLSMFRPAGLEAAAPCIYWLHGGGMVMGDRFANLDIPLDWLERFGAVVVTLDYRLAPEAKGATPVEDCYAGLVWVAAHATELGIDPRRLIVAGASAGGGLTAGMTLLARDRGGPAIAAQVLICPMLDHRNDSVSSRQFAEGPATWTRAANTFGWQALLGAATEVPAYVSPALAADLGGLPPSFIDTGSAELFRDEDTAFASRIWAAGGEAELHVWPGGFHGFDALFPTARLSLIARQTRSAWLGRILNSSN